MSLLASYAEHMPSPLVALAQNIYRIPTFGDYINTFALVDADGQVTLIDTGLKSAPKRIIAALAAIGKRPQDVTRIVLTHAHLDHAGGARRLLEETGLGGVSIHEDDAKYARTGRPPATDRTVTGGRLVSRLPTGGFPAVEVSTELQDGQLLPIAGGLQVIHTPGHTPGHISLLHQPTRVLITGDALFNVRSRLSWSIGMYCTSVSEAKASAGRLADLDYGVVSFMQGPELRTGGKEAIRGFLRRESSV